MVGLCRFGDAQLALQACRDTGFAILLAGGGSSSCWSNMLLGPCVCSWKSQRQAPSCPCSPQHPFFKPRPFGRPRSKLGHVQYQQLLHSHRWRLKVQWHSGASVEQTAARGKATWAFCQAAHTRHLRIPKGVREVRQKDTFTGRRKQSQAPPHPNQSTHFKH